MGTLNNLVMMKASSKPKPTISREGKVSNAQASRSIYTHVLYSIQYVVLVINGTYSMTM